MREAAWAGRLTAGGLASFPDANGNPLALPDALGALPLLPDATARARFVDVVRPLLARDDATAKRAVGLTARRLRLDLPGDERTLILAEIEVDGARGSLLEGATATSSSVDEDGLASNAMDGNTDGRLQDGHGLVHTEIGMPNPFLEIDLGATKPVHRIVLHGCSEAHLSPDLEGFRLRLLDESGHVVWERAGQSAPAASAPRRVYEVAVRHDPLRVRRRALAALAHMAPVVPDLGPLLRASLEDPDLADTALEGLTLLPDASLREANLKTLWPLARDLVQGWPRARQDEPAFAVAQTLTQRLMALGASAEDLARFGPRPDHAALGAGLYTEHCQRCHQENGAGLAGAFPPLAESPWFDTTPERVIATVLGGMAGPLELKGAHYDAEMPPFKAQLSDEEVAALLDHVGNSFGNRWPPVAPETVARVRAMTEATLGAEGTDVRMWTPERLLARYPLKPAPFVLFITGDEEYRSEESMPMLAEMLEREAGVRVAVAYAIDDKGHIAPNRSDHIVGLEALKDADLAVFFTRFRALPEDQLQPILDYVASGRPVAGFRTATHAFRYPKDHPRAAEMNAVWPKRIFGQQWITHHGHFGDNEQCLTAVSLLDNADHPILRGVEAFDAYSWLYAVEGPGYALAEGCEPLLQGKALQSRATKNGHLETNPVAWTREHEGPGLPRRTFFTTLGHPFDFRRPAMRRLATQGLLWALGMEDRIPSTGINPAPVGLYLPRPSGFGEVYRPHRRPRLLPPSVVLPNANPTATPGTIAVGVAKARVEGDALKLEQKANGIPNLGFWTRAKDRAHFPLEVPAAGAYRVRLSLACPPGDAGSDGILRIEGQELRFKVPSTGTWTNFTWLEVGTLHLTQTTPTELTVQVAKLRANAFMNLRAVELLPEDGQ